MARRVQTARCLFLPKNKQLHHRGRARGRCSLTKRGNRLPEATPQLNHLPGQQAGVLTLLAEDAQGKVPDGCSTSSLVHPSHSKRAAGPQPRWHRLHPAILSVPSARLVRSCQSHSDPIQATGIAVRDIPPPRPCTLSNSKFIFSV